MSDELQIDIRDLEIDADMPALQRVWREIGWSDSKQTDRAMLDFYAEGETGVAVINGEVECAVLAQFGTMRLDQQDLPLCVVSAVTTSRIARGLSLAQKLTARQLVNGQQAGAAVATLGMFDQGFYNKVGFGTGAYINEFAFDPGLLDVSLKARTPARLGVKQADQMLAAMMSRPRLHGSVVLNLPRTFKAELRMDDGFGLGYYDGPRLTHFVWMRPKGENGPYQVKWMGYENGDGLLELLALLKSLADQIYSIRLLEPPHVQLQSMLKRPFRAQAIAEKGKFYADQNTYAWYQLRVLDLPTCLDALSYAGPDIVFQLRLEDPIDGVLAVEDLAAERAAWRCLSGDWVVTLGRQSTAVSGTDAALPTLACTVNSFSRLLWGVASASSLAISDGVRAPLSLLESLDGVFTANPNPGWDF